MNRSADPFGRSQRANPVVSRLNAGSWQPAN
jgi:hypothetical protein